LRIKNQDNDFGYVGGTLRSLQGNLPPTISPQAAELSLRNRNMVQSFVDYPVWSDFTDQFRNQL